MEPQAINTQPNTLPVVNIFNKSKPVLVLAYITTVLSSLCMSLLFFVSDFVGVVMHGVKYSSTDLIFTVFTTPAGLISFVGLLSALFVILTKEELVYRIAKLALIITIGTSIVIILYGLY